MMVSRSSLEDSSGQSLKVNSDCINHTHSDCSNTSIIVITAIIFLLTIYVDRPPVAEVFSKVNYFNLIINFSLRDVAESENTTIKKLA